ncbi:MAG TPA: fibronectin type III domain-containing protein [Patescibacteria group bacterium]|nr:fibronectin type III domain-containing protein [Patescibacteria group bacterium]
MHDARREKKIPTLLALLLLAVLVTSLSFGIQKFKTRTFAKKITIESIEITNITHNTATIIWETPESEVSWLIYGKEKTKLEKTQFDDRDTGSTKKRRTQHYATLKNLEIAQDYFFKIATNKGIASSYNEAPFKLTTTNILATSSRISPAFGKVVNKNTSPLEEGIVILKIEGAHPVSTVTKSTGEWLIPLYYLIKSEGNTIFTPTPSQKVTIKAYDNESNRSLITTTFSRISPVPTTIVVGVTKELKEEVTGVLAAATAETTLIPSVKPIEFTVIFPEENAAIPGTIPLIKGRGEAGSHIDITLFHRQTSNSKLFKTTTNDDGEWKYTLSQPLSPGAYNAVIQTKNNQQKLMTLRRTFTIIKSGEAILGEATPEATILPQLTPTPTAFPQKEISLSPTNPPPTSGSNFTPLVASSIALILFGLGVIFAF